MIIDSQMHGENPFQNMPRSMYENPAISIKKYVAGLSEAYQHYLQGLYFLDETDPKLIGEHRQNYYKTLTPATRMRLGV